MAQDDNARLDELKKSVVFLSKRRKGRKSLFVDTRAPASSGAINHLEKHMDAFLRNDVRVGRGQSLTLPIAADIAKVITTSDVGGDPFGIGGLVTSVLASTQQTFGPPYPYGNFLSASQAALDVLDGTPLNDSIGVYFTSAEDKVATIVPTGTYQGSWLAIKDHPDLHQAGGIGIAVFSQGQTVPFLRKQVNVFSVHSPTALTGANFSDNLSNAHSVDFGPNDFGPIFLFPVNVSVQAGVQYLFAIYAYMDAGSNITDGSYLSTLHVNVPSIAVTLSDPVTTPPVH